MRIPSILESLWCSGMVGWCVGRNPSLALVILFLYSFFSPFVKLSSVLHFLASVYPLRVWSRGREISTLARCFWCRFIIRFIIVYWFMKVKCVFISPPMRFGVWLDI